MFHNVGRTDGLTDRQTDGQTDGQTNGQWYTIIRPVNGLMQNEVLQLNACVKCH